ncbi:MAG: DNA polymerase ligase N-terminal domain-containing protein [bacterium]|nr:DNA polymerase ligase N-terminal domain-containing protein [bacterium]
MTGKRKSRFVVQEHQARAHHYDFRLEMGGVLKSWAVPKGPSMDPAEKRLALMVEDHDLEHMAYEGIIPEGHYGAGPVVVWDQGTYGANDDHPEKSLEAGRLSFVLNGKKLKGEFALVRLKRGERGNEWLMIKKQGSGGKRGWKIKSELNKRRIASLKEKVPSCGSIS